MLGRRAPFLSRKLFSCINKKALALIKIVSTIGVVQCLWLSIEKSKVGKKTVSCKLKIKNIHALSDSSD